MLRPRTVLIFVILLAASMGYYHLALFVPRVMDQRTAQGFGNGYSFGDDLYPIWLTSREILLEHRDPYSPEMTQQIQIGLFGRPLDGGNPAVPQDYRAFSYPFFVDLLFWPLALFPFPLVRIALAIILPVATAFSVVLWLRALHLRAANVTLACLILLSLSNYAVLEGLFAQQMGLLVGFLLAASLAALAGKKFALAGSLLALTLIKPQTTALITAYLLLWSTYQWRNRWRFPAAFALMASLLVGAALLVHPCWISEWLQVLLRYRNYSTSPLVCYLFGASIGRLLCPFLISALLIGAFVVAWRKRAVPVRSRDFAWTSTLLLAITSVTLLPGHAVYDHVILLPGILLIAFSWRTFLRSSRPIRMLFGVAALGLFWQWIIAPVVILLRPFVSPQLFFSIVLNLPIRTAVSIPFGVLATLGIMMRNVARNQWTAEDGRLKRMELKSG